MYFALGIDIVGALKDALRWIGAALCNLIYSLISGIYQLFMTVSRLNILSSDEIAPIYQRITLIITIVMVFYITFEFVKYVIQPDTMTDKEKGVGNIVQRMIIAVVLIAFVPTIFSYAYKIQNRILENQIFSKVLLGKTNSDFSTMGNSFSANMLSLFYGVDGEVCKNNNCSKVGPTVTNNLKNLEETGTASITTNINETVKTTIDGESENAYMIKFNGVFAVVVGGAILWILLMYTIDVGTRYAQLLFLQIMSPVAIISYISPKKDGMFPKWTKQCITTYLDLFIRLAIIYFVLLIIEILGTSFLDPDRLFAEIDGATPMIKTLSYIALVMGLLVFAQKAPKMIGELLPGGGSAGIGYGFGAKGRIEPTKKAIAGSYKGVTSSVGKTIGAAAVAPRAIGGAIKNKTSPWSAVKAMGKGYANVFGKNGGFRKSGQAIRSSLQKDMDTIESGGGPFKSDLFGGFAAGESKRQDVRVARLENMSKTKETAKSSVKEMNFMKELQDRLDAAIASGEDAQVAIIRDNLKTAEKAAYKYSVTHNESDLQVIRDMGLGHQLELDAVGKWNIIKTNVEQAQKAANDIKKELIVIRQDDGTETTMTIEEKYGAELESTNIADFTQIIGKIDDAAKDDKNTLQSSKEYKTAHANAEKSGK